MTSLDLTLPATLDAAHDGFEPPRWLRGGHVQSILPSTPPRRWFVMRRARSMLDASRPVLLDCGDGVRLLGLHATHASRGGPPAHELVVLLHGWEGSADSQYVVSLAHTLFDAGFDVFRLNLRDHGPTHHLNEELFHSCRIGEVVGAMQQVQALCPTQRLSMAGFSLGGNFTLRVGARAASAGLKLHKLFAVCPVLDPKVTLPAIEQRYALYHRYFVRKWTRSLLTKRKAWPHRYDFEPVLRSRSLTEMTAYLVREHTDFPTLDDYLNGYAVTGDALAPLEVPTRIITAIDDPIIDVADLSRLRRVPALSVTATRFGGHCGYMQAFDGPSWVDQQILADLRRDHAG